MSKASPPASPHVRLHFSLRGAPVAGETVWAKPLGNDLYEVANLPFFAYGVTAGDVVLARPVDGILEAIRVARRGSYDPYRILVESTIEQDILNAAAGLRAAGFELERARGGHYAARIERSKREHAREVLEAMVVAGTLIFEFAISSADDSFSGLPDDLH